MKTKFIKNFFLKQLELGTVSLVGDKVLPLGDAYLKGRYPQNFEINPEVFSVIREDHSSVETRFNGFSLYNKQGALLRRRKTAICFSQYQIRSTSNEPKDNPAYLAWNIPLEITEFIPFKDEYLSFLQKCYEIPYLKQVIVGTFEDALESGCVIFNMGTCGRCTMATALIVRGVAESFNQFMNHPQEYQKVIREKINTYLDDPELDTLGRVVQTILSSGEISGFNNHHYGDMSKPPSEQVQDMRNLFLFGTEEQEIYGSVHSNGQYNYIGSNADRSHLFTVKPKDALEQLVELPELEVTKDLLVQCFPDQCFPELYEYTDFKRISSRRWYDSIQFITDWNNTFSYEEYIGKGIERSHDCYGGLGKIQAYLDLDLNERVTLIQVPPASSSEESQIWYLLNTPMIKYAVLNNTVKSVLEYGFVFRTDIHPTALMIAMVELRRTMEYCGTGEGILEGYQSALWINWRKARIQDLSVLDGGLWEANTPRSRVQQKIDYGQWTTDAWFRYLFKEDFEDIEKPNGAQTYYEVQGYFQGLGETVNCMSAHQGLAGTGDKNYKAVRKAKAAKIPAFTSVTKKVK